MDAERVEDHRSKMMYKKAMRAAHQGGRQGYVAVAVGIGYDQWGDLKRARTKLKLKGYPYPAANIGRNHPDYGMTPGEHAASKAERALPTTKKRRFSFLRGRAIG